MQAVKKALKAVLYRRDANLCTRISQDIRDIAKIVEDSFISNQVDKLSDVIGSHTCMLFSSDYNQEKATEAWHLAEILVQRAKALVSSVYGHVCVCACARAH